MRKIAYSFLCISLLAIAVTYRMLEASAEIKKSKEDLTIQQSNTEAKGQTNFSNHAQKFVNFTPGTCQTTDPIEVESSGGTTSATYTTLKAAFDAINSGTHTGTITIDVCGDTTETATATLNASGSGSANYTSITISPAGGAARTISGNISGNALIALNGADNVTIDGLNSGGNSLTISNTSTSSSGGTSTIRLAQDANNNLITRCSILGSSTTTPTTNGGTISISTPLSGGIGNDNNTISDNDIGPAGTNLPTKAIYANGLTTAYNNNITISNNRIFDYFSASSASIGIYISAANDNWTISGNRFYQTAARTQTSGAVHAAIQIASLTGNTTHNISGNIIGYSNASGTGTYQITLGNGGRFNGILISLAGTGGNHTIQNNTITNISVSGQGGGTGTSAAFAAILMGSGGTATISDNTIGSTTTSGAISYQSTSTSGSDVYGIYFQTSANVTISNNTVAGITAANNNSTPRTISLYAIRANNNSSSPSPSSINTIQNNTVGSPAAPVEITSGGTSSIIRGIYSQTGASLVTSNTVQNLKSSVNNTGININSSVIGILSSNTSATQNNISQNIIRSLSNTNTSTGAVSVAGLVYNGNTSGGPHVVARNFIHSLSVPSNISAAKVLRGIIHVAGNATYQNNMIRLGIDDAGNSVSGAYNIVGYAESAGSSNNFYHNTIYIGGSAGSSNVFSYAFSSSVTVNTRNIINNILINDRSITGGTGGNFAATYAGSLPNPSGLTSNFNHYYSQNPNNIIRNGSTAYSLTAWKTASNQDGNSFQAANIGQINLANPTGDAANVDLHISNTGSTVIEQAGTLISSVTDDFDGEIRANFTPVDVGADAGNFTLNDVLPPVISYTTLANTSSTANRNLSATITDATGVASGTLSPRIYYRKGSSGSYVSTQCSGTQPNYTCTIDYSLVGGVTVGNTIQYFVVAQDTNGNLGANPSGGFSGTDVNNITTPPSNPNQYTILQGFSGSYNVGTGETYTSLTNAGGIFQALNNNALVGNVVINITSDLTNETGANPLNQLFEEGAGAGTYTITIQPAGGVSRTIEFTATGAGIRFTGADRVTIDGLNSGGNSLTIRNPNPSATATISFTNDSSNNTVRNTTIEGAATTSSGGVVFFGSGSTTGNDNNTITQNVIRNLSVGSGTPTYLIYSSGSSATITNTNNSITNNILKNFTSAGIFISSTGNESWTITGNELFQESQQTTDLTGISFASLGTNLISQNSIYDLNTNSQVIGIQLADARNTTVSRNRIFSIPSTSGSTSNLIGILFSGASGTTASATIVNNMISIAPSFSNDQVIYGIRALGFSGNTVTVDYNTILIGGTATGSSSTWALVRGTSTPTTFTARNNIFFNNRTGGTGSHFAIGDQNQGSDSWTSNYNIFVGTGATPADYFDLGTSSSGTPVSFSAWQGASRDANSQASNPGGNYTVSNMFLSANDLHLNVTGTNPALSAAPALTTTAVDFDNDPRPTGSNPTDIGADEVVESIGNSIAAGTYYNVLTANGDSLAGDVTVNGYLTLTGVGNLNGQTLTLGCNAQVLNASVTNYLASTNAGRVAKQFCSTGSFTFPIGLGGYSPVTVNVTTLGVNPSTLSALVINGTMPGLDPLKSLNRRWYLELTGSMMADLSFNYLESDVNGNEHEYRIYRITLPNQTPQLLCTNPCVDATNNILSINGVSQFSLWSGGEGPEVTADSVNIVGRVTTADGRGIRNALVTMIDANGNMRTVITGPFGYYRFTDVQVGQTVIITVNSKRFNFDQPTQVLYVTEDMKEINFVARE